MAMGWDRTVHREQIKATAAERNGKAGERLMAIEKGAMAESMLKSRTPDEPAREWTGRRGRVQR